MSTLAKNTKATVIPCLRYRNAPAAIEWLCATFGFDKQAVYPNPVGTIAHDNLPSATCMIMLGSVLQMDIKAEDYGGRGFSCRDIEGHLWNLGTYDPW